MSEYEMVSLAQEYIANGMTLLMNFFTVLVAYLAAGFFAGHRLSLATSLFVTALFVTFSSNSLFLMYGIGNTFQALLTHMHDSAATGKILAWHPFARQSPNVWLVGGVALVIMGLAIVGAVYFFFEFRRQDRRTQASATS